MAPINCNLEVESVVIDTPIGQLSIQGCQRGVHRISKTGLDQVGQFKASQQNETSCVKAPKKIVNKPVNDCVNWLIEYFQNPINKASTPPFCSFNDYTPFYQKVWTSLKDTTSPGDRLTYKELSERSAGSSKSSRAVGTAMRRNPFMIVVPCHRVVKSNGDLGNYAGGQYVSVKKWLLDYENGFKDK